MPLRGLKQPGSVSAKLSALSMQQEERLAKHRAQKFNLSYADLAAYPFDADILELIPKETAEKINAVVFYKKGTDVRLGVVNPQLPEYQKTKEQIANQLGVAPQDYVISLRSFQSGLKNYRREGRYLTLSQDILAISQSQLAGFADVMHDLQSIGARITSVPPSRILSAVMAGALSMRASDIHLEPRRSEARLRYRIDGVLQDIATFDLEGWRQILSRIKILSELKINIHDVPQEGSFVLNIDNENYDVRVSILPGAYGEYIVLRLLNRKEGRINLSDLGMKEHDRTQVTEALKQSTGLILSAGPTGSGKTTTIAACLREINKPELKIITLEDPIEYRLPGIEQTEIDTDSGYTFAIGLRSILRQDPDVIFVGEMRDAETAQTSVHAAMTGHLVFSTIHSNDAPGVVLRLIDIGMEPYVLAPAIDLIIAQRLVRLVCPKCAVEYKVDEQQREHILQVMKGVSQDYFNPQVLSSNNLTFLKAKGCKYCGGTGYRGRTGVFEVITVKGEIEELILQGADSDSLKEAAIKQGMTTIAQDSYLKAIEKLTTVEEVQRISEE